MENPELTVKAGNALQALADGLEADGYSLTTSVDSEGIVNARIEASEDACNDCLVPQPVFETMIHRLLQQNDIGHAAIEVVYPESA